MSMGELLTVKPLAPAAAAELESWLFTYGLSQSLSNIESKISEWDYR